MENKIPKGWEKIKLGDVVEHVKDKVHNREEWTFDRYIGGEHFEEGEIRITKSAPIEGNEEVIGSAFHMRFKPGQVLYVTRNPRLRKGGMVDFEGVCSNVTFTLQANEEKLSQKLLPFIIQTESFTKHACNSAHGSTNPFLNWKDIASYDLLLPPMSEQKKIAEVLWVIEENIMNSSNLLKKLKIFRRISLKFFLDNSKKDKKFGELSDIAEITMGQSPPSSSYNNKKEGLPFFQGKGDFGKEYPIIKTYTTKPTKISDPNSILFTVRAPVGELNLGNIKCCIGRGLASIRNKKNTEKDYLYYILQRLKDEFNRLSQGTTFTAINRKELENFKVPLADLNEQKKTIVILGSIDNKINSLERYINSLKALRQKLTNELLIGKLRLN